MMNAAKSLLLFILVGCLITFGLCKKYEVYIMTGYYGPGKDSRVQFRILGEQGQTWPRELSPNGGEFRPFSKNVFTIDGKDVGKVTKVEVYFRYGLGWHIKRVLFIAGQIYIFEYNNVATAGKWTTIGAKCSKGFKTGSDGKCIDINECETNKPCLSSLATCHNTIGSYQCTCPSGYREVYGTCRDIDECSIGKPCGQYRCVNTQGSYRCQCDPGYEMDEGICVDINECKDRTDNCDRQSTQCLNKDGGVSCRCKPGYKWITGSRTRCELAFCSAQKPDSLTTYSPARCLQEKANKDGDICTRGCVFGYELKDIRKLKTIRCQDGQWSPRNTGSFCIGRRCPALPKIENVYYEPYSCSLTSGRYKGRSCKQGCKKGYEKVKGSDVRDCQKDGTWSGAPATCKKVWATPSIRCPRIIYKNLLPGKSTFTVGSEWRLPSSNYKNFTVSPAGANGQYPFPAGNTYVQWTVANPDGKTATCTQSVMIFDKESPKIVSCPGPTIFVTAYTKGPYHVTYKAPEFSDRTKCTSSPDDRGLPGEWIDLGSTFGQTIFTRHCPSGTGMFFVSDVPPFTPNTMTCDKATGKWNPDRCDCVDVKKEDHCESGYERKGGTKQGYFQCVQCGLGTYLKEGNCTMCAAGTYQDKRGQTTCNKCPSGTSSLRGDFICRDLCPAGTFSKDGMRPFCTLCPQGQYQDQQGQASCNVCPQNKFTNTKLGATSCQDTKPSSQQQNGLLVISSIVKPDKWDFHIAKNILECNITDNSFKLVSIQWKIVNKDNIPVDFLGKPKFEEIRNDAGKLVGSRLAISQISEYNERLNYVCVAVNINGETRKTVKTIPWPHR